MDAIGACLVVTIKRGKSDGKNRRFWFYTGKIRAYLYNGKIARLLPIYKRKIYPFNFAEIYDVGWDVGLFFDYVPCPDGVLGNAFVWQFAF